MGNSIPSRFCIRSSGHAISLSSASIVKWLHARFSSREPSKFTTCRHALPRQDEFLRRSQTGGFQEKHGVDDFRSLSDGEVARLEEGQQQVEHEWHRGMGIVVRRFIL